jgi:hypothetical protein
MRQIGQFFDTIRLEWLTLSEFSPHESERLPLIDGLGCMEPR